MSDKAELERRLLEAVDKARRESGPILPPDVTNQITAAALALADAIRDEQENEWRPIESAPKDGAPFLTYIPGMDDPDNPDDPYDIAYWSDKRGAWCKCKRGFQFVTHWMPLPEPPEEA